MTRSFGLLSVAVVLFAGAAIWLVGFHRATAPALGAADPVFCAHVAHLRSDLETVRAGSSAGLGDKLAAAQRELADDATRMATSGAGPSAAEAAVLATEVEQLRQAVLLHAPASEQAELSRTTAAITSVRRC